MGQELLSQLNGMFRISLDLSGAVSVGAAAAVLNNRSAAAGAQGCRCRGALDVDVGNVAFAVNLVVDSEDEQRWAGGVHGPSAVRQLGWGRDWTSVTVEFLWLEREM